MYDHVAESGPDVFLAGDLAGDVLGVVGDDHGLQEAVVVIAVDGKALGEDVVGIGVGHIMFHARGFHPHGDGPVLRPYGEHVVHGLQRGVRKVQPVGFGKTCLAGNDKAGNHRGDCQQIVSVFPEYQAVTGS